MAMAWAYREREPRSILLRMSDRLIWRGQPGPLFPREPDLLDLSEWGSFKRGLFPLGYIHLGYWRYFSETDGTSSVKIERQEASNSTRVWCVFEQLQSKADCKSIRKQKSDENEAV